MRILMAQINTVVGDFEGNTEMVLETARNAALREPGSVVVFPELTLSGYPPEDLLLKPGFLRAAADVFAELVSQIEGLALLGVPWEEEGVRTNACAIVRDGAVEASGACYHT